MSISSESQEPKEGNQVIVFNTNLDEKNNVEKNRLRAEYNGKDQGPSVGITNYTTIVDKQGLFNSSSDSVQNDNSAYIKDD